MVYAASVRPMPLPSVLLHDHLDGGLRVATILDLAARYGYQGLPHDTERQLEAWFDQSKSGSLQSYLAAFQHTIAVMQRPEALERVAYEAAVDLAADGVVYAEIRFCPALHTEEGLDPLRVIETVSSGLRLGAGETGLRWGLIVDSMRQMEHSMEMARLATSTRDLGVVAFDLAGPEADNPPQQHLDAFRHVRESGLRLTIHAGEEGDRAVAYISAAMDLCGAERLGHGVGIVDDCVVEGGEIVKVGAVAGRVRDRQVPLEICVSSNLATAGLEPDEHPVGALLRAGFNVTLNTDNRLMSNTSMSQEFDLVRRHHAFDITALAGITRNALAAAFCDHETKVELWEGVIAPAYHAQGADVTERWAWA